MAVSYRDILRRADDHFAEVRNRLGAHLECRLGCTGCCHGLFEIGAADLAVIADAIRAASPETRALLVDRSRDILETFDAPDIRDCDASEKEAFFARADDVPCPALDAQGGCMIYENRPIVCRTFGLPIREGEAYLGQECELNFVRALRDEKESAAWDLAWEDAVAPDEQYTIPEAIVLASLFAG